MLVANELEPVPELNSVSDGGGKREDGAVRRSDYALEGVALGTVQRVDLVENEVRERKPAVEDHELKRDGGAKRGVSTSQHYK